MDSHQQQQESPQAKTEVEDTGTVAQAGNFTDKFSLTMSKGAAQHQEGVLH